MQIVRRGIAEGRGIAGLAIRAVIVGGCAMFICGCNTTDQQVAAAPDVPADYRLRHPITISETDHTLQVFVGSNRGELNATQRAEVLAFAQTWRREATGGVVVDLPTGTSNEHAAAEAMRVIRSILAASGVPPDGIVVRGYQPPGRNMSGRVSTATTLKISLPGILAARTNATSPPWSITQPTLCSPAARPRPTRCGAPRSWKNIGQAPRPRRNIRQPIPRKSAT